MKEDQISSSDVLRILEKVCLERGQEAQEKAKQLKDNDWARGYESGYSLGLRWAAQELRRTVVATEKETAEAVQENTYPDCSPEADELQEADWGSGFNRICPLQGVTCYRGACALWDEGRNKCKVTRALDVLTYVLESRWP